MVGKSSTYGAEVQVFERLNGIQHLAETGRFKVNTMFIYKAFGFLGA